ncbi:MAG TPA: type II toxin-antitoxin system VapB family antitoxin [Geminicoccaceae bacterium]|nr:type II toxin-antitoxin system VapB family antitoxin [Geminicoccaceae bacterium]
MALNIRDPEVHELARKVAEATGETMTQAVKAALQERLQRIGRPSATERQRRVDAILEHGRRFSALPVLDPRAPDEILGYDEDGLPS